MQERCDGAMVGGWYCGIKMELLKYICCGLYERVLYYCSFLQSLKEESAVPIIAWISNPVHIIGHFWTWMYCFVGQIVPDVVLIVIKCLYTCWSLEFYWILV